MSTKVELLDHNPGWAEQAVLEAERFATALGSDPRLIAIHHIGSTSIPGIQAKGIIDLCPAVAAFARKPEETVGGASMCTAS